MPPHAAVGSLARLGARPSPPEQRVDTAHLCGLKRRGRRGCVRAGYRQKEPHRCLGLFTGRASGAALCEREHRPPVPHLEPQVRQVVVSLVDPYHERRAADVRGAPGAGSRKWRCRRFNALPAARRTTPPRPARTWRSRRSCSVAGPAAPASRCTLAWLRLPGPKWLSRRLLGRRCLSVHCIGLSPMSTPARPSPA
jgi:hypothetical protein